VASIVFSLLVMTSDTHKKKN